VIGGKKKYIEMFGSFMEPFNSYLVSEMTYTVSRRASCECTALCVWRHWNTCTQ